MPLVTRAGKGSALTYAEADGNLTYLEGLADSAQDTADNANAAASTAQSTANSAIPATQKGAPNGVATLNGSGVIPSSQLPSYVDDVLEFANLAAFPATGESGKIYVTQDTNFAYRWTGSVYVRIDQVDLSGYATTSQLAAKQNALTFDSAPTNGSNNPVTSDGIYDAIAGAIVNNGAITKSGGVVTFDIPAVYNADVDYTGVLTFDFTGAIPNTQVLFRSKAVAAPTSATAKGGNGWASGQENWLLLTYLGGTNVIYFNFSSAAQSTTSQVISMYATQDTPNTSTSGINVVGIDNVAIPAGRYLVEGIIFAMCSDSGGTGFATPIPTAGRGTNSKINIYAGRTGAATAVAQSNPLSPAGTLSTTKYATASTTAQQAAILPVAGYLYYPVDSTFSLSFGSTVGTATSTVMEGTFFIFRKVG